MHKSVYQNEAKMSLSYFRRQNNVSPLKSTTLLNASCAKTNLSHNKSSRLQTQSIYQLEICTEYKKTLKQRINQRISKELSNKSLRDKHQNQKNVGNQPKLKQTDIQQSQKRLSCIRKMLFEDESPHLQKHENKQNECHNQQQLKNQRMQRRKEFDERQKKQIQSRLEKSALKKAQQSKSELQQCTFKPKLTKYNPFM